MNSSDLKKGIQLIACTKPQTFVYIQKSGPPAPPPQSSIEECKLTLDSGWMTWLRLAAVILVRKGSAFPLKNSKCVDFYVTKAF